MSFISQVLTAVFTKLLLVLIASDGFTVLTHRVYDLLICVIH